MKGTTKGLGPAVAAPRALVSAALLVTVFSVASKVLGFGREAAMAAVFGASASADAFFVALSIPSSVFGLVGTVLTAVGVPLFTEYLNDLDKEKHFGRLLWSSFHSVAVLTLALAVVGSLLAGPLTNLIAPGFSPEAAELASRLTRVLMYLVVPMALSGWATGVLHAYKHFLMPAVVGLPLNMIMIASILLAGKFGDIHWLAWANLLAVGSQAAIQFPVLLKLAPRYRLTLDLGMPGVVRMARLAVPVMLGVGSSQINMFVDRILASGLEPGSISALNYAQRVIHLPYGLLGLPIIMVLYPNLVIHATTNMEALRRTLGRGLTSLAGLMVPVTVGMLALRSELVRFLFERGAFTSLDTQRTATALFFYGIGLLFLVYRDYLNRVSYALQDTWTPFWTGLSGTIVNVVLNLLLVQRYGLSGLAFSTLVALIVSTVSLLWILRNRLGSMEGMRLVREGTKIGVAAGLMGLFVSLVSPLLIPAQLGVEISGADPGSFLRLGAGLGLTALLGASLYAATCWFLRVEEVEFFLRYVVTTAKGLIFRGRART